MGIPPHGINRTRLHFITEGVKLPLTYWEPRCYCLLNKKYERVLDAEELLLPLPHFPRDDEGWCVVRGACVVMGHHQLEGKRLSTTSPESESRTGRHTETDPNTETTDEYPRPYVSSRYAMYALLTFHHPCIPSLPIPHPGRREMSRIP